MVGHAALDVAPIQVQNVLEDGRLDPEGGFAQDGGGQDGGYRTDRWERR